jgi:hypothetical protein
MKKADWKKILTASAVSIFVGMVVLAVVIYTIKKEKLSARKLRRLVGSDLLFWNGIKETSRKGAELLSQWWKIIGYDYSTEQLMSPEFQNNHYWSAIYISNLMKRWGAGDRFKYSARHSDYICEGKVARSKNDKSKLFWSYKPNEVPVAVGDLIGKRRKSWVTLDNICSGAPTHIDAVYELKKTENGYEAYAVGGNLDHTVKNVVIKLDKNKYIINPEDYLVVMKNQAI